MAVQTSMAPSGLAEVIDRILDKGLVIDAWVTGFPCLAWRSSLLRLAWSLPVLRPT